jgi:hypothetical protein
MNQFGAKLSFFGSRECNNLGIGMFSREGGAVTKLATALSAVVVVGWSPATSAQAQAQAPVQAPAQVVERTVKALPNRDTQIGVYINVLPDCSSGPLPTIRLASPPAAGKVVVKNAKAKATNYKACLALEVPAYVAFYKSPPDFLGQDVLTIEVRYAGGRTEIQKITVDVNTSAPQQKI